MDKQILLVEDTKVLAENIADILRMEGYGVTIAGDGEAALFHLKENGCDLVITDIVMPRMDGITLVTEIRRHDRFTSLPVIVLSAKATEETLSQCKHAGANLFLKKPCDTEYLLNSISTLLTNEPS
jgi:DNA-binding response OmpR family regulator